MKTVAEYIKMSDNFLLKVALFDMFKDEFNTRVRLSGFRGRYWDDAMNWYDRNVEYNFDSSNKKFTGFHLIMWDASQKQVYIKNEILNLQAKNYKHALNLVRKFLIENKEIINPITVN